MSSAKSPNTAQLPLEPTRRARPSTCSGGADKDRPPEADVAHDGRVAVAAFGPATRAECDEDWCSQPIHGSEPEALGRRGAYAGRKGPIMKRSSQLLSLAAGLAFAIAATQVLAQQPGSGMPMGPRGMMGMMQMMAGCPMMGPMMRMGADGHGSVFSEGRIAFLKAELAITDAQKAAWDAYAAAIKANLQSMQDMVQTMRAVFDAKTPVERLDAHLAAMEARVKALKDVQPALAKLYESLSADQKKKADDLLTGMGCMM